MGTTQPQMTLKRKERIDELDALRALAFLGVVFQHTLGAFIREAGIPISESSMLGMLFNLNKFAVPTFIFITGLTLFYNYYERVDYPKFIRKRIVELLLPYFLWTLIYLLYVNQYHLPHVSRDWLIEFGKDVLLGGQYYHLWYIPMSFQFYLFFPVLLLLFKQVQKRINSRFKLITAFLLFGLFYYWLMWFTVSYIGGGHLHVKGWLMTVLVRYLDRNFVLWIFYFVLGAAAGVAIHKWREFIIRSMQWNGFVFAGLFLWVGYELMRSAVHTGIVNLNFSTSLKPNMFLYTVSEILLLYGVSMAIANSGSIMQRGVKVVGKYSYGAYLAHAWVLNYTLRGTNSIVSGHNALLKTFVVFVCCSVLSVALTWLISKLPYGNLLVGASGKRKKSNGIQLPAADDVRRL